MTSMDDGEDRVVEELLRRRFSCRSYRPEAVPHEVIERMLGIAQRAASWCNTQPWNVIVTEGKGTDRFRNALFHHASLRLGGGDNSVDPDFEFPARYTGLADIRRKEVGRQLYEAVGIQRGDRTGSARQSLENFRLFNAPHALLIHVDRDLGTYGAVDCGVYLGTLLLAAESLGIAMIPQAALATYSPFVRDHFNIPDGFACVVGASFGYCDEGHPANSFRSTRAELTDAVNWVTE